MASVTDDRCHSCTYPVNGGLIKTVGDRLCERCRAVFATAMVLFDEGIGDEAAIVDTMSLAAFEGQPWYPEDEEKFEKRFLRKHEDFELVRLVDGVPVVRLRSLVVDVIRYGYTDVPKQVRIRVRSRVPKPESVAKSYEQVLLAEGLPCNRSTGGTVKWDATLAELTIVVGPDKIYRFERVQRQPENPLWLGQSFPPPRLIRELYLALLGSGHKNTRRGYAYALGQHGRTETKDAENTILACAAWYIGERDKNEEDEQARIKDRHHRIAEMLNRHVLRPLDRTELPRRGGWVSKDTVWRDAASLSDDLQRAWYFLTTPARSS